MLETTSREHAGAKPCHAGSATDSPCWRSATEHDLGETEPTLCTLHMQLRCRGETLDGWLHALEAMRAFMKSEAVDEDPHGILHELAIGWYDSVTEKAAEAAHKVRVAEFLAEQGPDNAAQKASSCASTGRTCSSAPTP